MSGETLHIYARVSTAVQEEQGTSLETQICEGKKRAQALGMKWEVWNEGGASSSREDLVNRPKLRQLLELVENGEVDHVYVWNTDRLSRNLETWGMIRLALLRNDVRLHTPTGEQRLSDPQTNLMLGVMSEFAIYDNLLRKERLVEGKIKGIRRGGWKGGPPPYGYSLVESQLVPNEEEKVWVRRIFEAYAAGESLTQIRSELLSKGVLTRRGNAVWSTGSIDKLLTNTHYGGYWTYEDKRSGEIIRNECPSIVPAKLIKKVHSQRRRRSYNKPYSRRTRTSTEKHFYLLRGLLVCGECGSFFGGNKKETQTSYYSCLGKTKKYSADDPKGAASCSTKRNIRIDTTDKVVWQAVLEVVAKSKQFRESIKSEVLPKEEDEDPKERKRLQSAVKKLDADIEEVKDSIVSQLALSVIDKREQAMGKKVLEKLDEHLLKLQSDRDRKLDDLNYLDNSSRWVNWLSEFGNRIDELVHPDCPDDVRRKFLEAVINKITVRSLDNQTHELTIQFRFPYVGDRIVWKNKRNKRQGYKIVPGRLKKRLRSQLLKKDESEFRLNPFI